MLIPRPKRVAHACFARPPAQQRGVTLLITLIVLVAMTLAAIALVRSVDTANVIAGNLAFRQNATLAGDSGTEAAIAWLEQNNGATLFQAASGYSPIHEEPAPNQTWAQWWTAVAVPRGVVTLPVDAAGNIVSYTIDRMCANTGDPLSVGTNCAQTTTSGSSHGSSQSAQSQSLTAATQIYYRITSRIDGPRNTVSYIQSVIAL